MSQTIDTVDLDRKERVRLIRKWGDTNTDGLLEETCQVFSIPEIEGFIGYREENSNAVVFGDPVCSPDDKPLLASAFQDYCTSKNLGVVYTIVSETFADWISTNLSGVLIEFGVNFVLDPFNNPVNTTGSHAVLVRKKVKQALKEGVTFHEYQGDDPAIEKQMIDLATGWVDKRKGPQIFLAHVTLFEDKEGKRWFYALHNAKIVGFLVLNEIQVKAGWLLNNVIMVNNAPHGLSELLIISTLRALEAENCHYVIAGPVPAKDLGRIQGIHGSLAMLTRWLFKGAKYLFHLDGYETFWNKFHPKIERSYLAFPKRNLGYSSVKALLCAFNMNISK